MTGYIGLGLACVAVVVFVRTRLCGSQHALVRTHLAITTYIALSLAIFYHGHHVTRLALGDSASTTVFSWRFQAGLALLALLSIVEGCLVVFTQSVFWRMLAPSLCLLLSMPVLLYLVGAGIINLAWSTIFGGTQSALLLATTLFAGLGQSIEQINLLDDREDRKALLDLVRHEMNGLMKMAFTGFLALGASLGVSMTILFRDGEKAWGNHRLLGLSFTMVVGFILVTVGTIIWIIKPYLDYFWIVRDHYSPLRLSDDDRFAEISRNLLLPGDRR